MDMASPESTARWVRLLPGTSPEAARQLRVGPTAVATSGSLGAMATMPTAFMANSTTFGSTSLPRRNGHGWAEATRSPGGAAAIPECTARWVYLLPGTSPEAANSLQSGPIAAAISGSLGALAMMPTTTVFCSTTFGSSILPLTNGRGLAAAARSLTAVYRPECTARWVRLLPGTSPEAALPLRAGPIAAAISGSLGARATLPAVIWAISTTFGSTILPQTNGRGWAEAARLAAMVAFPESTARWERLLPGTSPEAAWSLRAGLIAAAISGSLVAMATMPPEI